MEAINEAIRQVERQISDNEQRLRVALNEQTGWADEIQAEIDRLEAVIAQLRLVAGSFDSPAAEAPEPKPGRGRAKAKE